MVSLQSTSIPILIRYTIIMIVKMLANFHYLSTKFVEMEQTVVVSIPQDILHKPLKNLWRISFAFCQDLPKDIEIDSISTFAMLGFVDLSYSGFNLLQVQKLFRNTEIIKLNYIGARFIDEDPRLGRGFLIKILSKVWVLNEVYTTCLERQKWSNFFDLELQGIHSELNRKWRLDPFAFAKDTDNSVLTTFAVKWTSYPKFLMGLDRDRCKLSLLLSQIDNNSKEILPEAGSLSHPHNSILVLLLIASLYPHYPIFLLHDVLQQIFKDHIPCWNEFENCPLSWSIKDRLSLLGLLYAILRMDQNSSVSSPLQDAFIPLWILNFLPRLIYVFLELSYPSLRDKMNKFCYEDLNTDQIIIDETMLSISERFLLGRMHIAILEILMSTQQDQLLIIHAKTLSRHFYDQASVLESNIRELLKANNLLVPDDWSNQPKLMGISAKGMEIKLQFLLACQFVTSSGQMESICSCSNDTNGRFCLCN
jgi:hypothetical protein